MNVFIDANILLNFFHFTSDELDALYNVFASQEQGTAVVHLTEQVCHEFTRNREPKIDDALRRFRQLETPVQLPSFMRGYEEYSEIRELSRELREKLKAISEKATVDIREKNLAADHVIAYILERSAITQTSSEIYDSARIRMDIGNPPGKRGSIGDAINWLLLLEAVPKGQDLHIITEDGDFYSIFDENAINPFLEEEWREKKQSSVRVYRTLGAFMKEHFDGVTLSFDQEKRALIDELADSPNFAATHGLIASLNSYGYFSLEEARAILDAADRNNQVGMIITDQDISDFLAKAVLPHRANLPKTAHQEIMDIVRAQQAGQLNLQ
jgi:predicted nucleic acid-binding protein